MQVKAITIPPSIWTHLPFKEGSLNKTVRVAFPILRALVFIASVAVCIFSASQIALPIAGALIVVCIIASEPVQFKFKKKRGSTHGGDKISFHGFESKMIPQMGPYASLGKKLQSMIDQVKGLRGESLFIDKEKGFSLVSVAKGIRDRAKSPNDVPELLALLGRIQKKVRKLQAEAMLEKEKVDKLHSDLACTPLKTMGDEYSCCSSNDAFHAIGALFWSIRELQSDDFSNILTATEVWISELEAYRDGELKRDASDPSYALTKQGLETHK